MIPPKDWYDPLITPGILTFFGVLVAWLGWLSEKSGKSANWKWIGVLFCIAGMWIGYTNYLAPMIGSRPEDILYRAGMPSVRRFAYGHYLAFFLPLLGLIFCVVMHFVKHPSPTASESTPAA